MAHRVTTGAIAAGLFMAAMTVAGPAAPAGAADPTGSSLPPRGAVGFKFDPLTCGTATTSAGIQTISAYGKVKATVYAAPGNDTYYQRIKVQVQKWTGVGSGTASGKWKPSGSPADVAKPTWTEDDLTTYSTQGIRDSTVPGGSTVTVKATVKIMRVRAGDIPDTTVWKYDAWSPRFVECPDTVGEATQTSKKVTAKKKTVWLPSRRTPTKPPPPETEQDEDDGTKPPDWYGPPPPGRTGNGMTSSR